MISKKRIFSNNKITNYCDYNNNKNGCETLKTIKTYDNQAILKQFKSYKTWQILSASYFSHFDNSSIEPCYVKNLYDSNKSYIDDDECYTKNICELEKNILYPQGKIIEKKTVIQQFPSNIYLNNWCNINRCNINKIPIPRHKNKCDCGYKTTKKCGLCKNASALFI